MKLIHDFFSKVFYKLYSASRPDFFAPSEQDVFLVSFPRSGNTWMRVVLSELLYGKSGTSLEDIERYIPDIHFRPLKHDVVKSEFHIVKSHLPYMRTSEASIYKRVIYLIRDPRDVALSHYRYTSAHGYSNDFDHFLMDWLNGRIWPVSWREHVNSWTGIGLDMNAVNICLIQYEDLLSEPVCEIQKIADFIGHQTSLNEIQRVVKLASPENMRQKEKLGLRRGEAVAGVRFIGEATNGQWQSKLSPEQVKLIKEYAGVEMKRYGYI